MRLYVSLQWRPRLVLCPPGGLLQLWPVVYATMCTSHFIVIFVLHCIQWFCTIALYFHLVFSLFVVCWYPYIFIDVIPCTLMFLCEIRAIKISYSYSYSYSPNFNGATVEVWQWTRTTYSIPHIEKKLRIKVGKYYQKSDNVNNIALAVTDLKWVSDSRRQDIAHFQGTIKYRTCYNHL